MNRREERWGRERWAGDDYEWQRNPGRFRGEEGDVERGGGWDRSGEYQGREGGMRSQSGSGRWDDEPSGGYYGGREDYRGRDYRGGESGSQQGYGDRSRSGYGGYESERPWGMSFDEGRVQWRRREPGYGGPYGSGSYGDRNRGGAGGYQSGGQGRQDEWRPSGYGRESVNYPSGQSFGDQSESYGPQGYGRGGSRLMRYGRHEGGESYGESSAQGRYSGVGPKGYKRSPERLKEQVCDRLEENGELDASEIEVKMEQDGTVTLTGSVENRYMKRIAEDIAGSVTGVSDVSNQLKVRSRNGEQGGYRQETYSSESSGSESSRSKSGASRSSTTGTGSKSGF
jgi:hypothetical protein